MVITEKDGRLLVQFWRDGYEYRPDGQIVMHPNKILDAEIDVTGHIERAVEAANAPLRAELELIHGMFRAMGVTLSKSEDGY